MKTFSLFIAGWNPITSIDKRGRYITATDVGVSAASLMFIVFINLFNHSSHSPAHLLTTDVVYSYLIYNVYILNIVKSTNYREIIKQSSLPTLMQPFEIEYCSKSFCMSLSLCNMRLLIISLTICPYMLLLVPHAHLLNITGLLFP